MRRRWGRVVAVVAIGALALGTTNLVGASEPGTVVAGNNWATPNHFSGGVTGGDFDSSSFSFTVDPTADQPTFCQTSYTGGWHLITPAGDHLVGTLEGRSVPLTVRVAPTGPACGALVVSRENYTLSLTVTGGTGAFADATGGGPLTGSSSYGVFNGDLTLSVD